MVAKHEHDVCCNAVRPFFVVIAGTGGPCFTSLNLPGANQQWSHIAAGGQGDDPGESTQRCTDLALVKGPSMWKMLASWLVNGWRGVPAHGVISNIVPGSIFL